MWNKSKLKRSASPNRMTPVPMKESQWPTQIQAVQNHRKERKHYMKHGEAEKVEYGFNNIKISYHHKHIDIYILRNWS